jgi:voltage-gated potassium channel Kch
LFIATFFGYKKRPAFLTAISLAQISEFGLIIAAQGLAFGHINQEIFSMTVLLAVFSMGATTYFIRYEYKIYNKLSKRLSAFENFTNHVHEFEYIPKKSKKDVVLCGFNRIGYSVYRTLNKMHKKLLVVDFNPEIIKHLIKKKIPCIYGDVGDSEILDRLDLKKVEMVISTVPEKRDNQLLIRKAKDVGSKALIFVTANQIDDALDLYGEGADYVILPHFLGGEHVSVLIEEHTFDVTKVLKTKLKHIKELHHRRILGHEHPKH